MGGARVRRVRGLAAGAGHPRGRVRRVLGPESKSILVLLFRGQGGPWSSSACLTGGCPWRGGTRYYPVFPSVALGARCPAGALKRRQRTPSLVELYLERR